MKTSTKQARNFGPTISKIVMALAVASVMGAISMTPAFGEDNDHRESHQDRGRHGDRGDRHGSQQRYYQQRYYQQPNYYRHPYQYSQPVYAPPPVYYSPPPQAPGISFFFPLDLR